MTAHGIQTTMLHVQASPNQDDKLTAMLVFTESPKSPHARPLSNHCFLGTVQLASLPGLFQPKHWNSPKLRLSRNSPAELPPHAKLQHRWVKQKTRPARFYFRREQTPSAAAPSPARGRQLPLAPCEDTLAAARAAESHARPRPRNPGNRRRRRPSPWATALHRRNGAARPSPKCRHRQ